MKPLGTITMYFPFLDDVSIETIRDAMERAHNYLDFVKILNHLVLRMDVPDLVIYFAIHHSALVLDIDSIQLISEKYGKMSILRPNLFYASVHQGNSDDLVKVHESADYILSTDPPDWLKLEMRCLKFEADMMLYPQTLYDTENVDEIKRLIKRSVLSRWQESNAFEIRGHIGGRSFFPFGASQASAQFGARQIVDVTHYVGRRKIGRRRFGGRQRC